MIPCNDVVKVAKIEEVVEELIAVIGRNSPDCYGFIVIAAHLNEQEVISVLRAKRLNTSETLELLERFARASREEA